MEAKNVDFETAEKATELLFKSLNINLDINTPRRFVNMISELTRYHNVSNSQIAEIINKTFEIDTHTDSKSMVLVKNIDCFSLCEHHIALMYDMKISVAYIPKNLILGLSKIVRAVDMVCKRLQLQEKISNDIIEIMQILTQNNDIAVHIKAKHSCVTARGIKNASSETITTSFSGRFLNDESLKSTFLNSIN